MAAANFARAAPGRAAEAAADRRLFAAGGQRGIRLQLSSMRGWPPAKSAANSYG
jgi:hypothetical protein